MSDYPVCSCKLESWCPHYKTFLTKPIWHWVMDEGEGGELYRRRLVELQNKESAPRQILRISTPFSIPRPRSGPGEGSSCSPCQQCGDANGDFNLKYQDGCSWQTDETAPCSNSPLWKLEITDSITLSGYNSDGSVFGTWTNQSYNCIGCNTVYLESNCGACDNLPNEITLIPVTDNICSSSSSSVSGQSSSSSTSSSSSLPSSSSSSSSSSSHSSLSSSSSSSSSMSSSSSGCVISYIQSAYNVGNTSTTLTQSFTSNVTAGNSIVVAVSIFDIVTVNVTDNLGNHYTQIGSITNSPNGMYVYIAYNTIGGSCTVTATPSSGCDMGLGIHEYTPIAGVDTVVTNTGTSNTPSPGAITVNGSGEMCFAACSQGAFNQVGPTLVNNGFTIRVDEPDGAAFESLATADLSPTSSSQTPTFTLSSSAAWVSIGISFICGVHTTSSSSVLSSSPSSSQISSSSSSLSISSSSVSHSSTSLNCVINYVQSAYTVGNADPTTVNFTSSVTAGDSIIVAVSTYGVQTITVSDSLGNHYTQVGSTVTNSPQTLSLWLATNSSGGSCTVTATPSAACDIGLGIHEYSPIAAVDMTVSATGSGSTPSPGTINVSGSGEMCFAACAQGAFNQSGPTLVNNGFTIRVDEPSGATYESLATADLSPTSGNQTPTFTLSGSAAWVAIGASFICGQSSATSVSAISSSSIGSIRSSSSLGSIRSSSSATNFSSSSITAGSATSSLSACCPTASCWVLTASGLSGSGECCSEANGTFTLFYNSGYTSGCQFTSSALDSCRGGISFWTMTYNYGSSDWVITCSEGGTYILAVSSFNCGGCNTFNQSLGLIFKGGPAGCSSLPSTVMVCPGTCGSSSAAPSGTSSGSAGTSSTASSGGSSAGGGPACTPCGGSTPSTMSFTFSGATGAGCTSSNGSFTLNNTTLGSDCNFNDAGNIWDCYYASGTTWYLASTASFYYACTSFSCTTGGTFSSPINFGSCNGGTTAGLPSTVTVSIP